MSIGLPVHLAPSSVGSAFMHASHAGAFTSLSLVVLSALITQAQFPATVLWPGIACRVPVYFLLWLVGATRSPLAAVLFLAVGGISVFLFLLTMFCSVPEVIDTNSFLIAGSTIPLILVAPAGIRPVPSISWAAAGYAVGKSATILAAVNVGLPAMLDVRSILVAEVNRSWLDGVVEQIRARRGFAAPSRPIVRDNKRLADHMTVHQRTALRALLDALHHAPGCDPDELHLSISSTGSTCVAVLRVELHGNGAPLKTLLEPFLAVMHIVFARVRTDASPRSLTVQFSYGTR
ncbi:MAG: hypothetical protein ACOH1J_07465 [Microbacteriaceae bacterium]